MTDENLDAKRAVKGNYYCLETESRILVVVCLDELRVS